MPRRLTLTGLSFLVVAVALSLVFFALTTLHITTHLPNPSSTSTVTFGRKTAAIRSHPLAGFWHISKVHHGGDDGGGWKDIVRDQHQRLVASGLLTWAENVHVTVISNSSKEVTPLLVPPEAFNVTYAGSDWRVYEFPTLNRLADYCHDHPSSRVWYMHTFGSRFETTGPYYNNTWAWRTYLEHFVVTHFDSCVEALESGFNTCGAFFLLEPIPHFAGNMWWARCDYINTLPRLRRQDRKDMMFAQWWLGRSKHMRPKICHMPLEAVRPGMGLYDSYMDPVFYQHIHRC